MRAPVQMSHPALVLEAIPRKTALSGKLGSLWKRRSWHKLERAWFCTKAEQAGLVPPGQSLEPFGHRDLPHGLH